MKVSITNSGARPRLLQVSVDQTVPVELAPGQTWTQDLGEEEKAKAFAAHQRRYGAADAESSDKDVISLVFKD